jgi:hypothetical protein
VVVACDGAVLNDVWGSWLEGWIPLQRPTNCQPAPVFCLHAPSENLRRTY